jgi:hypothetical protein
MEIACKHVSPADVSELAGNAIVRNPATLDSVDPDASGRFSENHTAPHE